jgi:hypothetical protein
MMTAITSKIFIKPPVAIPVPKIPKKPKAQMMTKITAIV